MPDKRRISNLPGLTATVVLAGLLAACAPAEPPLLLASIDGAPEARQLLQDVPAFAGVRPEIVAGDDIYRLSAAQQEDFFDYYNDPKNRNTPGHKRLLEYLISNSKAFNYTADTRTADEVFRLSGGNCLSLANITTALARLAGVRVGYQLRDDIPVFEKRDDIILRGVHVRSVLYQPMPEFDDPSAPVHTILPRGPGAVVVDYFPTGRSRYLRRISEPEFTAMYYRNMAAEALTSRDIARAYWFTRESLVHAPDNAHAINMLAVLYRRSGDDLAAEQIYLYGLNLADEKLSLLKNYRILLNDQGRTTEAEAMTTRIAKYNDADPFEWWFLAEEAYSEESYSEALSYYQKSVEIAPYLHEGYFGMARSYFQLGRLDSAKSALQQAAENAGRARFRTLYEAKLKAFSSEQLD